MKFDQIKFVALTKLGEIFLVEAQMLLSGLPWFVWERYKLLIILQT